MVQNELRKEERSHSPFAHAKHDTDDHQPCKVLARSVGHERDRPHEDVDAKNGIIGSIQDWIGEEYDSRHPFGHGEALESQILGEFKDQIAEVEDGAEPVVSREFTLHTRQSGWTPLPVEPENGKINQGSDEDRALTRWSSIWPIFLFIS